jgi:hypothetical protein
MHAKTQGYPNAQAAADDGTSASEALGALGLRRFSGNLSGHPRFAFCGGMLISIGKRGGTGDVGTVVHKSSPAPADSGLSRSSLSAVILASARNRRRENTAEIRTPDRERLGETLIKEETPLLYFFAGITFSKCGCLISMAPSVFEPRMPSWTTPFFLLVSWFSLKTLLTFERTAGNLGASSGGTRFQVQGAESSLSPWLRFGQPD